MAASWVGVFGSRSRLAIAALAAAVLLAAPATAQQTGTLTGLVHDAQGGVLPGVTVTVSSDSLIGGSRTSVTGEARQLPVRPAARHLHGGVRAHRIRTAPARRNHRPGRTDRARRRRARRRQPAGDRHGQRRIAGGRRLDRRPRRPTSPRTSTRTFPPAATRGRWPASCPASSPGASTSAAPRARSSTTSRPSGRPTARSRSASTASR